MITIDITEESLSNQIEKATEELELTNEEREQFENTLYDLVREREEKNDVRLSEKAREQMVNMLASVWVQEYSQIQEQRQQG